MSDTDPFAAGEVVESSGPTGASSSPVEVTTPDTNPEVSTEVPDETTENVDTTEDTTNG